MTQQIITKDSRAVVITDFGVFQVFEARLYVNARNGLDDADATSVCKKFKTLAGAKRWADRKLAY